MAKVVIIGATSAIARATARAMAARGDTLYLLARNRERLRTVADELGASVCGVEVCDFLDFEGHGERVARAVECLGGLDLALIAHGDLGDQLESERSFAEARRQLDVNYTSVVSFVIALANRIEENGRGAIAVMSSVAAERGRPRNYTYAAAKSALNTYMQGVRSRLYPRGGRVHILKLGPVDTPMTVDHAKDATFSRPEEVARGILRAIDRGASEAYVPARWAFIMAVVRALPEPIFQRFASLSGR